jgi:hypothetical protein
MNMAGVVSVVCRFLVWAISVLLLVGAGCSTTKKAEEWSEDTDETKAEISGPVPIHYDFEDILIPAELSLVRKRSFVYGTPAFTGGVLVFEGRVTIDSLIDFFSGSMARYGWVLRSSFRYGRVILNFDKGERSCLISIEESALKTQVEIWVAPQVATSEAY